MLLDGLSDVAILWTMALLALVTGWVSDLRVPVVGLSCLIFGGSWRGQERGLRS